MAFLKYVPPMGIYETLYAFVAAFGKTMGDPEPERRAGLGVEGDRIRRGPRSIFRQYQAAGARRILDEGGRRCPSFCKAAPKSL